MTVAQLIEALQALNMPDADVVVEGYGLYEGYFEPTDGPDDVLIAEDGRLTDDPARGRPCIRML